jgi:hypothetical protein
MLHLTKGCRMTDATKLARQIERRAPARLLLAREVMNPPGPDDLRSQLCLESDRQPSQDRMSRCAISGRERLQHLGRQSHNIRCQRCPIAT